MCSSMHDVGGVARAAAWEGKKTTEICLSEPSPDFSASGFIVKIILCAGKLTEDWALRVGYERTDLSFHLWTVTPHRSPG